MNFKIGQRVVCIETHPCARFFKGEIHIVKSFGECACGIKVIELEGVVAPYGKTRCLTCENLVVGSFYASRRFAPLSERTAESEAFAESLITQLEKEVETLEWLHK